MKKITMWYFYKKIICPVLLVSFLLANLIASGQAFQTAISLPPAAASGSTITGEKPQSKVWQHDNKWWAVFPSGGNTFLWRLDGTVWTSVLQLTSGNAWADCKVVGNVTHILLYKGTTGSELASVEYVPASSSYQFWSARPTNTTTTLDAGVETATIDIDANGRMWLASDGTNDIRVRWSDYPYSSWIGTAIVASGINSDDIGAIICMPGKTGILWSNQATQRFGFKTINTGADPANGANWSADEIPASQSAQNQSGGMADDHLNIKVATDGTLYCAIKTSYDGNGYPRIGLLVRRPAGTWDDLYDVGPSSGTRPIIVLNEELDKLKVVYTSSDGGGSILYRESATASILFGAQQTLISGTYNNVTSTKANYTDELVILASNATQVVGVLASDVADPQPPADGDLVAHWKMDEGSGTTLTDATSYNNHATTIGSPTWQSGQIEQALVLNGTDHYASVPDHESLDITAEITLAAWIKPNQQKTQYIIRKGIQGGAAVNDGYELSLANGGTPFFRIKQSTSGDTYRVNATTAYPTDGTTWMHLAATYDGASLKIYVNGVLESTVAATIAIPVNNHNLSIGAQSNGAAASRFYGSLDDVRIYKKALTAEQILVLMDTEPEPPVEIVRSGSGYALEFDGSNDYVEVPHNSSLDITSTITLEAWVKPTSPTTQRIISKHNQGNTDGYELSISSDRKFFARFNQQTNGDLFRVNSMTVIPANNTDWYHVAATFDGMTIRLYVNGVQEHSLTTGGFTIAQNDLPLLLGRQAAGSPTYHYPGSMDDVRIWNVARTAEQIRSTISTRLTGSEPGLVAYWDFDETDGFTLFDKTANGNNGTMTNMALADRVWSAAAIGNQSAYDFSADGGYTANVAHADGDQLTVTHTSGTIRGLHAYLAEDNPLRDGTTIPLGWTIHTDRFWGVKTWRSTTNEYMLVYNYAGASSIQNEDNLRLLKRASQADDNWVDAGAVLDKTAKTLTILNASGTEYALAEAPSPLPVSLNQFSASVINKSVLLQWQTVSESNNAGFAIERSADGITYQQIAFVTTKSLDGNSQSALSYSYVDNNPLTEENIYRLKQVDINHVSQYSHTVSVIIESIVVSRLYPNPAKNELVLQLYASRASSVQILITDITGRSNYLSYARLHPGDNRQPLSISNLIKGLYLVRIISEEERKEFVLRFIKE